MITDRLDQIDRYASVHPRFPAAFSFLKQLLADPNLQNGKYVMNPEAPSEIYAGIQSYATKPFLDGSFETHETYIDLQFLLEGEELIYHSAESVEALQMVIPYSAEKDIAFYHLPAEEENSRLKLTAGTFCILFPGEAHAPSISTDHNNCNIRKIIMKINRR